MGNKSNNWTEMTAARTPQILEWRRNNPQRHRATMVKYRLSVKGTAAHLWKQAKRRAEQKGYIFTITKERLATALLKGGCERTGIPFVREETGGGQHPFSPSVDRIRPELGYIDSNIQVVCVILNVARGAWGDEPLMQLAKALVGQDNKHVTGPK